MSNLVHAVIFDFGGVLLDWNPRNLYSRYFPGQPEAMEEFLAEVGFMEWNAQQDRGRPFEQGVRELSGRFPHYAHLIRAYHEHWQDSVTGPIQGTVEILVRLKRSGRPLYALSNWSAETFPIARRQYAFLELFDDILISGAVSTIKPERRIFTLLLERIGRRAEECVFIDDSAANIETAVQLGFRCVHFQSPEQLERELREYGVL
jgi:2-haloacid dehalogenase